MIQSIPLRFIRPLMIMAILGSFGFLQAQLRAEWFPNKASQTEVAQLKDRPLKSNLFKQRLLEIVQNPETVVNAEETLTVAETSFQRNKRDPLARFIIATDFLTKGDIDSYVTWFLPLFTVDRDNTNVYAAELARRSANAELRRLIIPKLDTQPIWSSAYIEQMAKLNILKQEELIPLYRPFKGLQAQYLHNLVQSGQYLEAYESFKYFQDDLDITIPFDSDLNGQEAPLPFGWYINSQFGEFQRSGGVYISYFGRDRPLIMRQFFPLSPGQYSFNVVSGGDTIDGGGTLMWKLRCVEGEPSELLSLPLEDLKTSKTTFSTSFTIPSESCPLQTLILEGVPGQFPRATYAEIASVKITPETRLLGN